MKIGEICTTITIEAEGPLSGQIAIKRLAKFIGSEEIGSCKSIDIRHLLSLADESEYIAEFLKIHKSDIENLLGIGEK